MTYPNFFIVGAAKSGTSSLWQHLKENPSIFMPADELYKEPGFFSDIRTKNKDINKYLKIFKDAEKQHIFVGEASTAYLTDPSSAKNIYNFYPQAKIIIMLRNPADRTYSLYNWMTQDGYEYAPTFEIALKLEEYRMNKKIPNFFEPEYYYNYLYFNSGLYYKQVKKYLDLFGSKNVYIIKFDDFKNNFDETYSKICAFLGIKKNIMPPKISNKSKRIYSPIIQFSLRKINNFFNKYFKKEIKTKNFRDEMMKLGLKNEKPKKIKNKTRKILINKYKNDIKLLSKLTNMNFNDWIEK